MSQQQVSKQKAKARTEESNPEVTNTGVSEGELQQAVDDTLEKIDDVLDDQLDTELLDAIDDILEEDAGQFVNNFIQEGGE